MRTLPDLTSTVLHKTHTPAASTAAVATIAAVAEQTWVVRKVWCSFGVTVPTSEVTLVIEINSAVVFTAYLAKALGVTEFDFSEGLYGAVNQAVVCTILDPTDATCIASIDVLYQ